MLLGGATGIGKTFLALNIVRAFAVKEPLFGYGPWEVPAAKKCLFLESEVGLTLQERLELIFADVPEALKDFHILSQPIGFNLSYPDCLVWLKDVVKRLGIDILVLDPFSDLHLASEDSNTEVARLLGQLRVVQGDETSMIVVHHFGKEPKGPGASTWDPLALGNFRGASKLTDSFDTILTLDRRDAALETGLTDPLGQPLEAWTLDASWEKVRHGRGPIKRFVLNVNEVGNGRVLFVDDRVTASLETPFDL